MRTVLDLKNSRIPPELGICPTDARLLQYYNEWQEDALNHGRWWGTIVSTQIQTNGGLIAWPRNVANVELLTRCGQTIQGHNQWYRFMDAVSQPYCDVCGCAGLPGGCGSCGGLIWTDEGMLPVFRQLTSASYIKLYPGNAADIGKKVLIQGYDSNGQWVRRQYGLTPVDGEYVVLTLPFAQSTVAYNSITGIQKEATGWLVRASGLDASTSVETPIAQWEGDETSPQYRVIRVPNVAKGSNGTVQPVTLNALVKLEHIPVQYDTDWLVLQCSPAIRHGLRSRMLSARDQDTSADKEMARSIDCLNQELRTHNGDKFEAWVDIGCEDMRRDLDNFR